MPRKFTIGLGSVNVSTTTADGLTVAYGTGSFINNILSAPVTVTITPAGFVSSSIRSQESAQVYHPTLFEDFGLGAKATYNFFTTDEASPTGSFDPRARLSDLPRYVTLTWRRAPSGLFPIVSNKGTRPQDRRTIIPTPLPVGFEQAAAAVVNGYIGPGVIRALVTNPAPSPPRGGTTTDDSFLLTPAPASNVAGSYAVTGSAGPIRSIARVSFIDPSIAGAMDPNRLAVSQDSIHVATMASLAKVMGPFEVTAEFNQDVPIRNSPPQFPTDPATPTARYIGYAIERYDLGPGGSMQLGRTFNVTDPDTTSFVDKTVSYLGNYAYRIRALFQWTRPPHSGFGGHSRFDLPAGTGSVVSSFGFTAVASFYAGGWSDWARAVIQDTIPPDPPDELTVMPHSAAGRIRVSWKMPRDPRRDIKSLRIYRRPPGGRWEMVREAPPTNGAFDDRPPAVDADFIYAAVSVTYHGQVSTFSEQITVRLTSTPTRGELRVKQSSERGARFGSYTPIRRAPIPRELRISRAATFFCRSAPSDSSLSLKNYVVELRSLSTGERLPLALQADAIAIVPKFTARKA